MGAKDWEDNVPHFSKIKSYPRHKHLANKVIASEVPGLVEVIDEVGTMMVKKAYKE